MDALRDPNLDTIGVYGMGGVGKTTLANEVQGKALQEKLFETVLLVEVSQAPEVRRIQGEIAGFLGLKFVSEEIPVRASQLYKQLESSRVLLILDDLWQKLDLNVVGIPSRGASKVCKMLLTSRNRDLLSNEIMGAQKLFSLETLKEEETLSLFQMCVPEAKDPNFRHIAVQIAKKCGGLPLLIQIVATDLRHQESHVWKDALNKLSTFGDEEIYAKVYKVVESSYENLPSEEMKSFFLLCSLVGQFNFQIQHLLAYSVGLGLFKHIRTIEDARNRVLTMITKLKAKSLLLDGEVAGFVKMHDVVRDTALNIASREKHAFIAMSEVRLRDWPSEECTTISLPFCDVSQLPLRMACPEAEMFLLFTEDLSLEISDSFFTGNKKLKVIDFTGMHIMSLPSSIGSLASLLTLYLNKCRLDDVAVLGELKQLELLSFAGSKIARLPREIEELTQLKLLDLRDCSNLEVIPANFFSRLYSLEELYMLNSFVGWEATGNVSLVELENLACMSTLEIQIPDIKMIPKGFKLFSLLRRYKISIGDLWDWNGKYERSRVLKLKVETGIHLEDGIELLMKGSEDLYLDGVRGIESVFCDVFPHLKHLHVGNDYDLRYLIKSTRQVSCNPFPILESLYLTNLQKMEKICRGQLEEVSLGNLQILKIWKCKQLRSLFSFSLGKCLEQLRELEVVSCKNMEAVVEGIEDVHHNNEVIEFTQLNRLKLQNLPNLKGFCTLKEGSEQKGLLFDTMVSFPCLTILEVIGCNSLKYIFTAPKVKCLMQQLEDVEIEECELVEEILWSKNIEGGGGEDNKETNVFPNLNSLSLENLPSLKRFSSCYEIEFPSLRVLRMHRCDAMGNFVGRDSSSESTEEHLFNEMVTFPNLDSMSIRLMSSFKYLWDEQFIAENSFFKLKSIYISECSNLSVVFPSKVCTRFQRLESLWLFHCYGVQEIYGQFDFKEIENAFCLKVLRIDGLSINYIWNKESEWHGSFSAFPNLQSVEVNECVHLQYLFPAYVGLGLLQLRQLNLRGCYQLKEMIGKKKEDETADICFKFPELKELRLLGLEEMKNFYTLDCPKLKNLAIEQCPNISLDMHFIPNLKRITIDEQSFLAIHQSTEFSSEVYIKLKEVTLKDFNEETSIASAFSFVSGIKSLQTLVLEYCTLDETLGLDDGLNRPTAGEELRAKHLYLSSVSNLKLITKKDSQHLHSLNIWGCNDLMYLAPSSTSLQNLTYLHLDSCNNVMNLVTASTAKTMVQLSEMKVIRCRKIEEIVARDGDHKEHDEVTFNKLKLLKLEELPELNSFSPSKYIFCFPLLEHVTIEKCPRMNIFCGGAVKTPRLRGILSEGEKQWEGNLNDSISSQATNWVGENLGEGRLLKNLEWIRLENNRFSSKAILLADQMHFLNVLREITVTDCDSIHVVFDLEGAVGLLLPKLNFLRLINLPMLSQLCNKAPKDILHFNKLKVLHIDNCSRLVYTFTLFMASCLSQLEQVEVRNCEMMETLIIDDGDAAAKAVFTRLENVVLENMPRFSSFYSGSRVLECPSLENVTLRECPSIKAFFISTHDPSSNPVFPKMENLSTDMQSIRGMMQFEANMGTFSNIRTLKLEHCSATTKSHVARILSRTPNLNTLLLCSSSLKELTNNSLVEAQTMPHIKSLTLENIDNLNKIWWHASLFQSLETLRVECCGKFVTLASSSASFQNLSTLKLYGCNQLMNLMTPSVATTMVQLKVLKISNCKRLMEIVGNETYQVTNDIIFTSLQTLKFVRLYSLKGFSLTHNNFKFPCLDKVILHGCPNLRIFCHGNISTPMLKKVEDYSENCYWEGDLNTTTKYMYQETGRFVGPPDFKLSTFPVLKQKWEARYPISFFYHPNRLEVDDCELFSSAIPSHRLQHLEYLHVLIVEKCDSIKQVIDLEGLNADECGTNHLKYLRELHLIDLPKLNKVWSKDPQQILSFKKLESLKVHNCGSLTFIFSLSMALSLQNLQCVEVENCISVEYIIVEEEETLQKYQTIFPSLESMSLLRLTNLVRFCSTSRALECPSLKMIEVFDCPNMELFGSTFSEGQDSFITVEEKGALESNDDPDSIEAFLGNKMAIPRLEVVKVEWKELIGNNQCGLFSRLKCIELAGFQGEPYAILPPTFLHQFPQLENLRLSDAFVEEINLEDLSIHNDEDHKSLAQLTNLKLSKFPNLKHLVHLDCQFVPLFQKFADLEVVECNSLKILVPPLASFQNLTDLDVSKCHGLKNLISASTARSLVQLRRMKVMDCKMMRQIIDTASDEEKYEIRFSQLESLELDGLPCITCFSSGNYEFHFPSLEEVMVTECPVMKNFAMQLSVTPKLRKVKTGQRKYEWEWEGSLNDTIQALYMEKDAEAAHNMSRGR